MKLPESGYWVLILCADFCTAPTKVVEGTSEDIGEVEESEVRLSASGMTRDLAFTFARERARAQGALRYIELLEEKQREGPTSKPG